MQIKVLTAVFVLACLAGSGSAQCSEGWVEIGGDCFAFIQAVALNWNESNYFCAEHGAMAAKVSSADVFRSMYEYIVTFDLEGSFWVGASDLSTEDNWLWRDLSRVDRGTPYWALNNGLLGWELEPQGGDDENCLALAEDRFYYFDDRDCSLLFHPLCQM